MPTETTSTKGLKAVAIVVAMLKQGMIALPLNTKVIDDKALQIKGTDVIVQNTLHLQVKCDFAAGPRDHGGTGNLFLQTQECNPYKLY